MIMMPIMAHNIKNNTLEIGSLTLLFDNKFSNYLGKLCMRLMRPFQIGYIIEVGTKKLSTLAG